MATAFRSRPMPSRTFLSCELYISKKLNLSGLPACRYIVSDTPLKQEISPMPINNQFHYCTDAVIDFVSLSPRLLCFALWP